MSSLRHGFTLLELIVAVFISGITLSLAAATLLGIRGRTDFIRDSALTTARGANAEIALRQWFGSIDDLRDTLPVLTGTAAAMRLRSSCPTPHGWDVPCVVMLWLESDHTGPSLLAEVWSDADSLSRPPATAHTVIRLFRSRRASSFLYLVDAHAGGTWRPVWSERTPPLAAGIVLDADTLILPVGRAR